MEGIVYSVSMPDAVDRIVSQWAHQRPDLDVSPMLVIGRLHRVADRLDAALRSTFADAGLGDGEFDVLATLRRAGSPHTLSPSQLAASMMVTSGATTKRIDRLERRGLVSRSRCDTDGRGRSVTLTDAGARLVDEVVERHVANEARLLEPFSVDERTTLANLLSRWMVALEDPSDDA